MAGLIRYSTSSRGNPVVIDKYHHRYTLSIAQQQRLNEYGSDEVLLTTIFYWARFTFYRRLLHLSLDALLQRTISFRQFSFKPNSLSKITSTNSYLDKMLLTPFLELLKPILQFQTNLLTKSYIDEVLIRRNMLLRPNVTRPNVIRRKCTRRKVTESPFVTNEIHVQNQQEGGPKMKLPMHVQHKD